MSLLAGLDEITAADAARVGGKAVALAALQRAGMTVPPTVCLTAEAYRLFLDRNALRSVIEQELGRKDFADMRWEELWDAALRIRNRFVRAPVPDEIVTALDARLPSTFGERPLVVRSSAPGEDSGETSFAGLHDSFVGVRGRTATIEAVRNVWASLWTDRALLYRRELGIDVDRSTMAVVLQELIEGPVSGVAFGVHPGDPALVAVEAVHGLNQGLVDGTVEPDRFSLERDTGRVVEHVAPAVRRRLVARDAGTAVEPLDPGESTTAPLDAGGLAEVWTAVRAAGELFGAPQDVEWTFDDGRLVVLQSRPITTSQAGEGDKRAWYLSLTRSLDTLLALRDRVERELLPEMDREADEIASRDPGSIDTAALADEIERRREAHDRWVEVYWRDFIPLAHGIRLFGQFYNDVVRPDDPYEFMGLLASSPLLSVRRNRDLAELAASVRDDADLRARLERGERGDDAFESAVERFEREHGDAAYGFRKCFGDRGRLVALVLAMAEAPATPEARSGSDVAALTARFLEAVPEERAALARELLDLGRASYRLRDDDNIHLARLEALVLDAVEEARRRLRDERDVTARSIDLERLATALRHPNLVAEPRPGARPAPATSGFRVRPRQLVGQPAGPGVATGPARLVEAVDDLFRFRAGEVLVCDAVDPNMTFVVPMASAVVERRGGMLIHGAIIAREYGLPCVTGVPQATTEIANGDRLTVDGFLGIVTVSRE